MEPTKKKIDLRVAIGTGLAALALVGGGLIASLPAQAESSHPSHGTSATEDGTNDGEAADDQAVEDGANDGETADDQALEDGTNGGETADDQGITDGAADGESPTK